MASWTSWLRGLDQSNRIGALVHVGTVTGEALDQLLATRAGLIYLVSAHPAQHSALQSLADSDPRVVVLPVVLAGRSGQVPFHALSLPHLSSFCPPREVQALFHGLQQIEQAQVPAVTLAGLLDMLILPEQGSHVLRIETPGSEAVLVQEAAVLSAEPAFEHVFVRGCADGLYDGVAAFDDTAPALQQAGYETRQSNLTDDPDFPEHWLHRDPVRLHNRVLTARLAELEAALSACRQTCDAQAGRLSEADSARGDADSRLAEARQETAAARESLAQARADLEELRARYRALEDRKASQEALLDRLAAQIGDLVAADPAGGPERKPGRKPERKPGPGRGKKSRRKDRAD
ncbi:hypothetical protein [Puniceibacterium confluentis]|uniref:hypothetical protein n=1 Tax=Puniceibacterium confluentis TaxID=1958944 RepID=UPI0011B4C854|nr:hypothetical protein [Puniceibacterium confluentis]